MTYTLSVPGLDRVAAMTPSTNHAELLACLRTADPRLATSRLSTTRGDSWLARRKVLDTAGRVVRNDHQEFLKRELESAAAGEVLRRLKGLDYQLSKCELTTLFVISDNGGAQDNFVQTVVLVEDEFVDCRMFDPSDSWREPKDLFGLCDAAEQGDRFDALNGTHGRNRAARALHTLRRQRLRRHPHLAVAAATGGSHTWRAYRKEAERFLLWAVVERGTAFSSLRVEDCVAYRDFLADPQPRERWCGPMVARFSPAWRPFQGKLSASRQMHALVILCTLCEWLMRQHYLDSNPWDGVPERAPTDPRIQIEKALPMDLWQRFWGWLEDESSAEAGSQARVARAAVALLRDSGVRLSEACSARREKMRPAKDTVGGLWELTIVGKRNKLRTIPVSPRTIEALRAHWRDRAGDFGAEEEGALLAPVVLPATPSALAKTEARRLGYSASGVHGLITTVAQRFADQMSVEDPTLAGRAKSIRAHAIRHTFGVHSTEADIALDVTQQILGHAPMSTTTIYVQGDRKRRLRETGKLYREGGQRRSN